MSRRLVLIGLVLLIVAVGVGRSATAQGTDSVGSSVSASSSTIVVNESDVEVTIALHGDSSNCPVSSAPRPVDAVLVIDVSDSMNDLGKIDAARNAAIGFVNTMKISRAQNSDQVGVVVFNGSAQQLSPLSRDKAALQQLLRGISADDGTSIAAGLRQGTDTVTDPQRQNTNAVRAIVLLTDGQDDQDSVIAAANQAKSAGARLVVIGLGTDVNAALLRSIASSPSDYYEAPGPADLPRIYTVVAKAIQPTTAGRDIVLKFQINPAFQPVTGSDAPPFASVQGNTISWTAARVDNGETRQFTFRLRASQPVGSASIGSIVESNYLFCDTETRRPLTGNGPQVAALLPTPSPTPTPTNTPIPSPTSTATVVSALSGGIIPASNNTSTTSTDLSFCEEGLWSLLPLILALILMALGLGWALYNWNRTKCCGCTRWCFLANTGVGWYALFLIWLFARPPISAACPVRESVYFWRKDPVSSLAGMYLTAPNTDRFTTFSSANLDGCVGCHAVSSASGRIAAIGLPPHLNIYDFSGKVVRIPDIEAVFASFSPDGNSAVIANSRADLLILDLLKGTVKPLQGANDPNVAETMPSWGPNGHIAFVRATDLSRVRNGGLAIDAPTDIYTIPVAGGQAVPLQGASGSGFNYYPAYSPDGRWLAFTHHNHETTYADSEADIFLIPAKGGAPIRIAANDDARGRKIPAAANSWPSWSRDSRTLAFNSKRNDTSFDIFTTVIDNNGNSSEAVPLPGASKPNVFEHLPYWGPPARQVDVAASILALWPWLLPLVPLVLLALVACRTPIREPDTGEEELPEPRRVPPPLVPEPLPLEPMGKLWDPQPTLIIGLGNTGRWVLTHLKKALLDANLGKMPANVRLLCIDTGDYEKLATHAAPVEFAGVSLAPEETIELKDNLPSLLDDPGVQTDPQFREWLTQESLNELNRATQLDLGLGAQGQRLLARAGFLMHLREEENFFTKVIDLVPACLPGDKRLSVVVVGDTFGDVSSAILFDVALLVREAGKQGGAKGTTVVAHLVTDAAVRDESRSKERDQANTGATLREIERFQLAEARPFPIFYEQIPGGRCRILPINDLILYDGAGQRPRIRSKEPTNPRLGVFPTVADSIVLWMDTAAFQDPLRTYAGTQRRDLQQEQLNQNEVFVYSQNLYSIRLPFADLIDEVRSRFEEELVRRLIMGNSNEKKLRLDATLNLETYLSAGHTPEDLAKAFAEGAFDVDATPPVSQNLRKALYTLRLNKSESLPALGGEDVPAALVAKLRKILTIILNGTQPREQQPPEYMFVARGGKIGFAIAFLKALEIEVNYLKQTVAANSAAGSARGSLNAAFDVLLDAIHVSTDSLKTQAEAIGVGRSTPPTEEEDTLLKLIGGRRFDLQKRRDEMNQLYNREYLWVDERGEPLETRWYSETLDSKRAEALGKFYWQIGQDNCVSLTLPDPDSDPNSDKRVALDPANVAEFESVLLEIATRYCKPIDDRQEMNRLLADAQQSDSTFKKIVERLHERAHLPLDVPQTGKVQKIQRDFILAADQDFPGTAQIEGVIRPNLTTQNLYSLDTTDRYFLGLSERIALVSLASMRSLNQARKYYRLNHDLSNETDALPPQQPILTAVYEAESVALQLERLLVDRLHLSKDLLHPLVVTALTDSKRVKALVLALATGEIEMRTEVGEFTQQPWLVTPHIEHSLLTDPAFRGTTFLHPLAAALLNFVLDGKTFTDNVVSQMLERYGQNEAIRKQFRLWTKGEWQDVADSVEEDDTLNQRIVYDILKVSRLYADMYKL